MQVQLSSRRARVTRDLFQIFLAQINRLRQTHAGHALQVLITTANPQLADLAMMAIQAASSEGRPVVYAPSASLVPLLTLQLVTQSAQTALPAPTVVVPVHLAAKSAKRAITHRLVLGNVLNVLPVSTAIVRVSLSVSLVLRVLLMLSPGLRQLTVAIPVLLVSSLAQGLLIVKVVRSVPIRLSKVRQTGHTAVTARLVLLVALLGQIPTQPVLLVL